MRLGRVYLLRAGMLVGAALMLQGCLVAALPVVAGGALATRDVVRESQDDPSTDQPRGEVSVDASSRAATTTAARRWR